MPDLDELRLFAILARTLHFGRASAEGHVSPSTLSRAISRLEAEAGRRLFDRDRRAVALTADGVRLLAWAEPALAGWDAFRSGSGGGGAGGNGPVTGTLAIYCTVTASQSILPDILARFRAEHPGVHIDLETGYAANALAMLDDGLVDVTVAALPDRPPRSLLVHVIAETPLVLVTPATATGPWRSLPMVLPASGVTRELTDRWLRQRRLHPVVEAEVHGHEAILSLVALGCGAGVVPELVLAKSPLVERVRPVRVRPPLPGFRIGVATTPDRLRLPPVAALWSTIEAEAPQPASASRSASG
jgi:LysR family transcriptional regulator, positive regulator for ilvC